MVKIRYAGTGVALSSRFIIEHAITNTSAKFGGNIIANRFEQTTTTTYEVTIKCISSRGQGAKRGASGRRTSSCCWHAWGTFFDELFKLNPRIVIVAQGNRITREGGNWVDRIASGIIFESEMCDCEDNGWVRETPSQEPIEETIPQTVETPPERDCITCRYSIRNTASRLPACPPGGCSHLNGLQQWEPIAPQPTIERWCSTCRHSVSNNGRGTLCDRGSCSRGNGAQRWELYTPPAPSHPTPPGVLRHCVTCRYSVTRNPGRYCTRTLNCTERAGFQLWEQIVPVPRCVDCAYSRERRSTAECPHNTNDVCLMDNYKHFARWVDDPTPSNQRRCRDCKYAGSRAGELCNCNEQCLIGSEHRLFVKRVKPIERTCEACKYSESNNNGVMCYTVVGTCGLGNPKWERFAGEVKTCNNCKYWDTNCRAKVRLCLLRNKWQPRVYLDEFDPEPYLLQPQVMPEEKKYMGIFGGE